MERRGHDFLPPPAVKCHSEPPRVRERLAPSSGGARWTTRCVAARRRIKPGPRRSTDRQASDLGMLSVKKQTKNQRTAGEIPSAVPLECGTNVAVEK